jgi:hypothetical protein
MVAPTFSLTLHQLLERHAGAEYERRRQHFASQDALFQGSASNINAAIIDIGTTTTTTSTNSVNNNNNAPTKPFDAADIPSTPTATPYVHFGVGCDACGMIPIVGARYRCSDV